MRMHIRASVADEEGQANLFLLIGLTLSLIALMLLFIRLGNAHDLRSESQTAADAAALAAAGVARDNAAQKLAQAKIPYSRLYEPAEGRSAAESYAQANGAVLDDIRASDNDIGNTGNIVRVEVHSAACQRELEEDGSREWADTVCDGEDVRDHDTAHVGNAAATAEVVLPDCEYIFGFEYRIIGIRCDGQTVQSFRHAQQLIDVRLVEEEGQYIYKPIGIGGEDDDEEPEESPEP